MNPAGQVSNPYTDGRAWNGQYGYHFTAGSIFAQLNAAVRPNSAWQGTPLDESTVYGSLDTSGTQGITATGAADGVVINTRVSTLLYVYHCLAGAMAGQNPPLGFSTTAPTYVNGTQYLGTSGNALQCLFIGWVFLDAAGNMNDSVTQRNVVNFYNRRPSVLSLAPGYNNNNAATTFALTANVWARVAAGTADTAEYISNGEDAIYADAWFTLGAAAPAAIVQVGIGDNSNTTPSAVASFGALAVAGSSCAVSLAVGPYTPAKRTLTLLGYTANLATTFEADQARNGSASDPQSTGLYALVPT